MYLTRVFNILSRGKSTTTSSHNFEHVFAFPFIKNFALINRLKMYHIVGSCLILPSCGVLEILNAVPESSFLTASVIGVSGAAVLSLASIPFKNVIGHLFISEDNKLIKISSLDFYGRRKDRIIKTKEWMPLLDLSPKKTDVLYLSPQLIDGTKYKLPIRFGIVKNPQKMAEILD